MALPGAGSYNASKAGVELFVRSLRAEVGWRGVCAASIHPSWIDTAMVRESAELASFRELRDKLPWPLRSTTSVESCARQIVDGAEARRDRIFVPRSARLVFWLRNVLNSRLGEAILLREASETVPRMDAELERLGRSVSARNAEINAAEKTTS